jgi:16S rRNA (cytosine1402-N4)-methyltransferase
MRLHEPVLLSEAIALLQCRSEGLYVDCTLGMGGHSEAILKATAPEGKVLAFDRDQQAIDFAARHLSVYKNRLTIVHDDFRNLTSYLKQPAAGILADFGPSMLQFSTPERGFSFQSEGPLDMRMNQDEGETAAEVIASADEKELRHILQEFGEDPNASRIARKIISSREEAPIETTSQLRALVESVVRRKKDQKIHPATRTFQALRIAVNHELENLDSFIFDAFDSLEEGGRLVLISFHSLEDRVVKQTFRFLSAACRCPKNVPVCECGGKPLSKLLMRKPVTPSAEELQKNPASRSAKLRAIEKVSGLAPRHMWQAWLRER